MFVVYVRMGKIVKRDFKDPRQNACSDLYTDRYCRKTTNGRSVGLRAITAQQPKITSFFSCPAIFFFYARRATEILPPIHRYTGDSIGLLKKMRACNARVGFDFQ